MANVVLGLCKASRPARRPGRHPAHAAFGQRHVAAAHDDHCARLYFQHQCVADIQLVSCFNGSFAS